MQKVYKTVTVSIVLTDVERQKFFILQLEKLQNAKPKLNFGNTKNTKPEKYTKRI